MNPQKIEVGTVTNYGIKGEFDANELSNVLEFGANAGKDKESKIPGWKYNDKAFKKTKRKTKKKFLQGISGIINGNLTIDAMINKIGIEASTEYKEMIEEIKSPANSPATIRKKGFDNPMIETGHFKSNIAAKINKGRIVGRGGG